MSAIRTQRATPSERACLQCQRRKTRCMPGEDGGPCSYCSKAGKTCVFSDKPTRTPLTRKNLDDAEDRIRRLESLIQSGGGQDALNALPIRSQSHDLADGPPTTPGARGQTGTASTPYEWNESSNVGHDTRSPQDDKAPDGMASLADGGERSGYLGNSSGYSLLQSVSSLLPPGVGTGGEDARQSVELRAIDPSIQRDGGWSSHQLSATLMQDQLIGAYFRCYNSSYPILHEKSFRDKCLNRSKLSRDSSWHLIYFMVLAIGEWVSGYCSDEHSLYYDAARSRFRVEHLESGNANNVQAFLLMGNFLQKRDRPNTGYNFIGIAYRMALGLGLHREPNGANAKIDNIALHRRRVLFWTLYCFDSGFSITTGRPILVTDSFIDVRSPANIDDSQSTPLSIPQEVSYPTTYSAMIAQARLARIANRIYTNFMSTQPCTDVEQQSSVMEAMIHNWRASLPGYFFTAEVPEWFVGPRQTLFWKQANLHMLLLLASQRHLADAHDKIASGRRFRAIACETIQDIYGFCRSQTSMHHGLSWYAIYFLLQACLALSVHQVSHGNAAHVADSERDEDLRAYEEMSHQAQSCLQSLTPSNKAATRSLRVLGRLRENVRQSSSTPRTVSDGSRPSMTPHGHKMEPRYSFGYPSSNAPVGQGVTSGFMGTKAPPDLTPNLDNVRLGDWGMTADPSFHMFFDGADNINDLFQGVEGFPGTVEQDDFAYQSASWPFG